MKLKTIKKNSKIKENKMAQAQEKEFVSADEFGFDDMLNSNVKKKETKKASKKSAEIVPVPADVQAEIDKLLEAKKAKKQAESNIKKAEPTIIDHGLKMKDENAYNGKFQKSYKLGNDDNHVNMVTANKWSFKEEDVDQIKEIIGEEKADGMIVKETEVRLKPEVFKDPELKQKFVQMVGMDFPEFFETHVYHHVSDDFDEKVYDHDIDLEDLRLLMKQSKPSLR